MGFDIAISPSKSYDKFYLLGKRRTAKKRGKGVGTSENSSSFVPLTFLLRVYLMMVSRKYE